MNWPALEDGDWEQRTQSLNDADLANVNQTFGGEP